MDTFKTFAALQIKEQQAKDLIKKRRKSSSNKQADYLDYQSFVPFVFLSLLYVYLCIFLSSVSQQVNLENPQLALNPSLKPKFIKVFIFSMVIFKL